MATMMMHMSRISEEIIIWNTNEYQFVDLDDTYSTGSSIMPQKKNPDIAELIRGKTGRVYGALTSLLTTMKGIPLAYNKDMQEDKELVFDALTTTKGCLQLLDGMLKSTTFNKDKMRKSATGGFTNATDAADYLVNKGVPFRDAHGIIGQLVLYAIDQNKDLDDLTIAEFKAISEVFDDDIDIDVRTDHDVYSFQILNNSQVVKMFDYLQKKQIRLNDRYGLIELYRTKDPVALNKYLDINFKNTLSNVISYKTLHIEILKSIISLIGITRLLYLISSLLKNKVSRSIHCLSDSLLKEIFTYLRLF